MDIYLPIAGQSVNALLMVALGGLVGLLSGMFGVGGGFLTTPLLMFYGIPPTVAVASATTQITGSSVSGVYAHMRRGGVDVKMGLVMIAGGILGSFAGAGLFRILQNSGQIDLVIGFLYVILLGGIGGLMLKDALVALGWVQVSEARERPRHNRWIASLPLRWRFYASGLYLSPLAPLALGFAAGAMTVLLGIGGGFILVPAMIYLLGMAPRVVVGTSLIMILAVSAVTTMVHAMTTQAVDIVLAALLLVGGVIGAQYGAVLATRLKPDLLRMALAIIILLVALRMLLGLTPTVVGSNTLSAANAYSSSMFYIVTYVLTTLGTFGLIMLLSRQGFESDEINDLAGLGKRAPWMAGVMTLLMFSLAGIPPLVGFYAKLAILQALVTTASTPYIVLAVFAVVMSLIGAFYYLRVVKVMYFDVAPAGAPSVQTGTGVSAMLAINGAAVLVLGLLPGGLMAMCRDAIVKALSS